jgi:ABC-type transport system involved in multi-copper enzyme maturation permease subunit
MVSQSTSVRSAARGTAGSLRRRQVLAVIRLELRKSYFGGRGIGLYLLAALPLVIPILVMIGRAFRGQEGDPSETTTVFAWLYQYFILHFVLFLGCVLVFGNVMRREVLDRTLHYYFLTPLRRELLVLAKYATGVLATTALFGFSTLATYLLLYLSEPKGQRFLLQGPGLGHLAAYLLVTVLGCIGYGATFLAFGSFVRSPIIPALALFGWEFLHFLLPPLLKQISVIHYLLSLCPVPLSQGPLAILSDAPSPWVAIPGLLLLSAALVAVSAWRARKMEVAYEED